MILSNHSWVIGSRTISEATQQQVDAEVRRISMNNIKLLAISWKIIKILLMHGKLDGMGND
jgi:hypothetical protein